MPLSLRKRGKHWYARGTVPAQKADGSIGRVRIEESTRSQSKARAREVAADIERHYHNLAYGRLIERGPSFAEAALTYVQTRGKSDRFVTKLIRHFGETPISEIDQAAVSDAANALYPGCSASTHTRAVYAPVTTVLRLSGVNPNFKRPRIQKAPVVLPPKDYFDKVLGHCPPKLAALLITLTLRGRRVSELLGIPEGGIDFETGTAVIHRTKTGDPVQISIPDTALDLLKQDRPKSWTGRESRSAFGYVSRSNVYRALKQACERAGIDRFSKTHSIGRHSFASRLLAEGRSVKFVAEAGKWKSPRLVLDTYGHLEQTEVDRDVKKLGEEWGKKRALTSRNPSKTNKKRQ